MIPDKSSSTLRTSAGEVNSTSPMPASLPLSSSDGSGTFRVGEPYQVISNRLMRVSATLTYSAFALGSSQTVTAAVPGLLADDQITVNPASGASPPTGLVIGWARMTSDGSASIMLTAQGLIVSGGTLDVIVTGWRRSA